MAKLIYKMAVTGEIHVLTGLHIGGSDSDLDIGGIDNSVIKTKNGVPFIPGSSLKGKMRDLIARSKGYNDIKEDKDETLVLFSGTHVPQRDSKTGQIITDKKTGKANMVKSVPTRLIIRDCFWLQGPEKLEEKAENTIKRSTGVANPRHIERVWPETVFKLDMILDVYDVDELNIGKLFETLKLGFNLLENDYLGGSGSRGYGKVEFNNIVTSFPYIGKAPTTEVKEFKFK
jgi:CRISPR-associated protein Csm3